MKLRLAEEHVAVGPGRRVALYRSAPLEDSRVVVFCHPAPGAGLFDPDPGGSRARGVALLAVDRPGYGGSDPIRVGRRATVASAADDIAAVLDAFGVERAGVVGWSAGGRVALALAARRPELVDRVAVLASPAPDDQVAWIEPAQRESLEELRALSPEQAHAELEAQLCAFAESEPVSDDALIWLGVGPADEGALRMSGARRRLDAMVHAAFVQGVSGLAADIAGYTLEPWGFEPEEVRSKTLLLYGARDPIAPPRHGSWWQSRLPNARLEVCPGVGHLLAVPMWHRVLSHVAPGRARPASNVGTLPVPSTAAELDHRPAV
jgi:pimeloyl-ACP methyl ester carboxylesterase